MSNILGNMARKQIIAQRKLEVGEFDDSTSIIRILKAARMFNTGVKVNRFVRPIICEFYANLVPELIEKGKAYVRGVLYDFSPKVINEFYDCWDSNDDFEEDIDVIVAEMSGGHKRIWIKKDTLVVSHLTTMRSCSTYARLIGCQPRCRPM